jgi:hypothetical protein
MYLAPHVFVFLNHRYQIAPQGHCYLVSQIFSSKCYSINIIRKVNEGGVRKTKEKREEERYQGDQDP